MSTVIIEIDPDEEPVDWQRLHEEFAESTPQEWHDLLVLSDATTIEFED